MKYSAAFSDHQQKEGPVGRVPAVASAPQVPVVLLTKKEELPEFILQQYTV